MRILFLGGTGIISTACSELAVARGHDLYLLNRGREPVTIAGARTLIADLQDPAATATVLAGEEWDAVVDFVAFKPADIERDLRLFRGRTAHYIFISSASAYQRPLMHYRVTESTPLENPFWEYSRDKIACEERLRRALENENFPATIVRPSLTYGDTQIPLAVNSWRRSYTAVDRLRRGRPLIVPGDGTSLWTLTHNSDFAKGLIGLLGNPASVGESFHISSDEVLSWNQCYAAVAEAADIAAPRFVHIATDFITACLPDMVGTLTGDKTTSIVLDNAKIKRFVPGFAATTPFRVGVARSIAWHQADLARQLIDAEANERWDRLLAAYDRGLDAARRSFGP